MCLWRRADGEWRRCLILAEPNRELIDRLRAAPEDSDDAVVDTVGAFALFDADRRGGGMDICRRVLTRQLVRRGLVRPVRKLHHLRRGRFIRADETDFVHPLDPGATV